MKNHVKQMLRIPLQLLLMIVLVMIVTVMLVVGGNLWVTSDRISKAYEDDFITIGTVTQKSDTMRESTEWDAEKGDYLIDKGPGYNRYATEEDLAFPEVEYIVEPEKRVYWGSCTPEYVHANDLEMYPNDDFMIVAEFSPMEDCIPNESVKIKITKILGDAKTLEGAVVWFCDHHNRYPEELKADKTYVAKIGYTSLVHGKRCEDAGVEEWRLEYGADKVSPLLYTPEGKKTLADEIGAADREEEQKDGAGQETEIDLSDQERVDIRVSCMMGGLVILLGVGISTYKVRRILSGEPLYLVSGEEIL